MWGGDFFSPPHKLKEWGMEIGNKVKVKAEFKKKLVAMPVFAKMDLNKPMTVVGFEWPKVLVKENSGKWRVGWLEEIKPKEAKSGKTTKKQK
jgi:hypothetical protein